MVIYVLQVLQHLQIENYAKNSLLVKQINLNIKVHHVG